MSERGFGTIAMNKKQVFVLEILDNQKGTWQGTLSWVQGHEERSFRSTLELLHLIDSVINGSQESESEPSDSAGEAAAVDG